MVRTQTLSRLLSKSSGFQSLFCSISDAAEFLGKAALGSAWRQHSVVTTKGKAQESCRERLYLEVVVSCRALHFYDNSKITVKTVPVGYWILLSFLLTLTLIALYSSLHLKLIKAFCLTISMVHWINNVEV